MRHEHSGKIYRFPLAFHMGYGYCELLDFSDISDFSGRLVYVFSLVTGPSSRKVSLAEIQHSGHLFGPVPINNYPNVRGKGAWVYVGKRNDYRTSIPILKEVQGNYTMKEWSKLDKWYKLYDFEERSDYLPYEQVRTLELPVLYQKQDIQARATMQLLLEKGEDVRKYYDLKDFRTRQTFIITVNTSMPAHKADVLLAQI
jgi:hypothetical protein